MSSPNKCSLVMAIVFGFFTVIPFIQYAENNSAGLVLSFGGFAEARHYRSIALPECQAEIPDDITLPPYNPAFGHYEYAKAADGSTITLMFYYDLRFKYFDKEWEELAPYVEVVKWERGIPHLIGLSFVNEECKFVLYADENNDTELPAVDRLVQVREPSPFIKRAPRPEIKIPDQEDHKLGKQMRGGG